MGLLHSHFKEDRAIIPTVNSHRPQGLLKFVCHGFYPDPLQNELLTDGIIVFAFIEDVQNANQYLSSEEVYKGWLVTMGSTDRAFISLSASGFAFIIKRAKDMTVEIIYTGRYSFSPVVSEQVSLQLLFLKLINYFETAT